MPQFYVAAKARMDRMRNRAKVRMDKVKSIPCCKVFMDSLMALISRILYIGHAVLTVWRVTEVLGTWYWTIALWLISLIVETCIVVFRRGGKEWKWFQPCILIYLMVELPSICMLELEKASQVQIARNSSVVILHDLLTKEIQTTGVKLKGLKLSDEWWSLLLNQSMMILLIIARWLMPKGDLTRDQLSALLLYYLGTASDIVDFFSVLSEGEDLLLNITFIYTILCTWAWSMIQFIFVVTMTVGGEEENEEEDSSNKLFKQVENGALNKSTEQLLKLKEKKLSCPQRVKKKMIAVLSSEAWAICISMVMQDGPFAIVRVICLFYWGIRTYTNYFFTFKNVLVFCLQIYRLVAVYEEYKKSAQQAEEKKKEELTEHLKKAAFKAKAINALSGRKKLKREDTLESLSEIDEEEDEEKADEEEEEEGSEEDSETDVISDSDDETDYEDTERSEKMPKISC